MILDEGDLRSDERAFLAKHSFGFLRLTQRKVPLSETFGAAARCALEAEALFLLALLSQLMLHRGLIFLCILVVLLVLAYRVSLVALLATSAKFHKRAFRRAALYWSWWPTFALLSCALSAACGAVTGVQLWRLGLGPYYELAALQRYGDVDPSTMPGEQVQDAGVVDFPITVGLDRASTGCFVHGGHNYCVAPIVSGSTVGEGTNNMPRFGSYDYFAAGVDCCDCPITEFKCGAWEDPVAHGGLRSLDFASRPFFRLAVDSWSAAWGKRAQQPLFFDWVRAPAAHWRGMRLWALRSAVLAACAVVPIAFCYGLVLARLRGALQARGLLAPSGVPEPPPRLRRAWELLLPDMLHQQQEEQRQRLAVPAWWAYGALPGATAPPVAARA